MARYLRISGMYKVWTENARIKQHIDAIIRVGEPAHTFAYIVKKKDLEPKTGQWHVAAYDAGRSPSPDDLTALLLDVSETLAGKVLEQSEQYGGPNLTSSLICDSVKRVRFSAARFESLYNSVLKKNTAKMDIVTSF